MNSSNQGDWDAAWSQAWHELDELGLTDSLGGSQYMRLSNQAKRSDLPADVALMREWIRITVDREERGTSYAF